MRGVWNLFGHNLPSVKPGTRPPAARINVLRESMERMRPLTGPGNGVNLVQMPNGVADRSPQVRTCIKARITTAAGPLTSATAPGSGAFVERVFDGTAKADGRVTGTCYNDHDKTVAVNSEVVLTRIGAYWWITDVDKCTNLS